LVVRCLRGSRPAGALPAVVVTLLVRCLCWRCVWSPKGPRPAAGLGAAWGLGVWLSPLPTQDSSFLRSRAEVLRLRVPSVDLPPSERSEGGRSTDGGGERERILPSCGTVHTKEESFVTPTQRAPEGLHSRVRGRTPLRSRRDPVANAEALARAKHERRSLRPTRATARDPGPARSPAARSRPFRRPPTAKAEAAQRQGPHDGALTQPQDESNETHAAASPRPDPTWRVGR
jgi:hypothetical protein